jgi:hypothetical protein
MAAENLYPFSTPQGSAVPLEVVKPKTLVSYAFPIGSSSIVIPAGISACWIYSTQDCILRLDGVALPAALVDGVAYSNSMFIPAATPMSVIIAAGDAQILGLTEAGNLYINGIEQWAALAQPLQTSVG